MCKKVAQSPIHFISLVTLLHVTTSPAIITISRLAAILTDLFRYFSIHTYLKKQFESISKKLIGNCILFSNRLVSWTEAQRDCQSHNMTLLQFNKIHDFNIRHFHFSMAEDFSEIMFLGLRMSRVVCTNI